MPRYGTVGMTKLFLESLVEEQALPERVSQVGGTARERKELYLDIYSHHANLLSSMFEAKCEK